MQFCSVITGSGAYIPPFIKRNADFSEQLFYDNAGVALTMPTEVIIEKFRKITGISERRYADAHMNASEMASLAGREAVLNSGIDPETLDQIVVAHNFGDVDAGSNQSRNVPALACRVKSSLGIHRPDCIASDVIAGCPGWLHAVIQTHAWFLAGMSKKVLLIGTETLSRVTDEADRDSMIFSDGAGAVVMEQRHSDSKHGILGWAAETRSWDELDYIDMGESFSGETDTRYIKMKGRKVYEFALKYVPLAMKQCLENSGVNVQDIKKILIHQANEKMDNEILNRFYGLYGMNPPANIMPMTIDFLGNSSVATIPTLYHLIQEKTLPGHSFEKGQIILLASVGAGMNINAVCYRL